MNLKAYLATIDMTFRDFGKLVDADPKYISQISKGRLVPSRRLARDIEQATHGLVKISASTKGEERQSERATPSATV